MFLVYNSDVLSENAFRLSINDRAFHYGDGLFETIRYENQQLWFWPDHFIRLTTGMKALQLQQPDGFTAEAVSQQILKLISVNGLTNLSARIKIQLWRQPGGLYTPTQTSSNLLITAQPGSKFSVGEKANAGIYNDFRLTHSPISAFKTLNALPYVLAGLYKQQHALDEVILLNTDGNLAECLASNLFWYNQQTLFTPSLQTGCIDGILRKQLLQLAPSIGIQICEGLYQPEALQQAEALFCTNVMGIQWIRRVDTISPAPTPFTVAEKLLNSLFAQLHR